MKLDGKIAIITGASRGIGRASAITLARAGARVIVNFVANEDAAHDVVNEIINVGGNAMAYKADVRNIEEVKALFGDAKKQYGHIDILVNNAGIIRDNFVAFMTEDEWEDVIGVNLKGTFNCTKIVSKIMTRQRSGKIINISSCAGIVGDIQRANYSAAKAGIIGLTKAVARELAISGVTVNAIAPGIIESDMIADMQDSTRKKLIGMIPLGKFGRPEDVSEMVLFLASDCSKYITGQVFYVDGGLCM